MTGKEPWCVLDKNPDDFECCDGYNCFCNGITVRQSFETTMLDLPKLEYINIDAREVGEWSRIEIVNDNLKQVTNK